MDSVFASTENGAFSLEAPKQKRKQALFIQVGNLCINTAYIVYFGEYGKQQINNKAIKLKYALKKNYIDNMWMTQYGGELINPTGTINTSLACQAYDVLVNNHPDVAKYSEYDVMYRIAYTVPQSNSSSINYETITREQYEKIREALDMITV